MWCKCQQTAGDPPAPLNSSVTKQTSKTNMGFALWDPHYATCPSGFSWGAHIVSEPLLLCYVFIKKDLALQSKKTWAVSLQLCPLTVSALAETKSPSNPGKMKETLCWETIRCLSERDNGERRKEKSEGLRISTNFKLCAVCEREKMLDRKLGDSSGHDELDVSFSPLLQRHFY